MMDEAIRHFARVCCRDAGHAHHDGHRNGGVRIVREPPPAAATRAADRARSASLAPGLEGHMIGWLSWVAVAIAPGSVLQFVAVLV